MIAPLWDESARRIRPNAVRLRSRRARTVLRSQFLLLFMTFVASSPSYNRKSCSVGDSTSYRLREEEKRRQVPFYPAGEMGAGEKGTGTARICAPQESVPAAYPGVQVLEVDTIQEKGNH